jgi:hypothetical protein
VERAQSPRRKAVAGAGSGAGDDASAVKGAVACLPRHGDSRVVKNGERKRARNLVTVPRAIHDHFHSEVRSVRALAGRVSERGGEVAPARFAPGSELCGARRIDVSGHQGPACGEGDNRLRR